VSQITFLDRMVAWAAPEAGVRRALARRSFEALSSKTHGHVRGYDGAAKGRRSARSFTSWRRDSACPTSC